MIEALTVGEKALLATNPHKVKMYAAFLPQTPVWKARVNDGDIATGEMTVAYDGVTLGTPGDVKIGHTLWVGSTEGARDLGTVRVKAIPDGSDIEVAQNDIAWVDDAYLTVIDDHEWWLKLSRMADDGAGGLLLKWDYDEGWQAGNMPPIPIAGPPACAFIDEDSGLATVRFVGNLSYPLTGSSIVSYTWYCPGSDQAYTYAAGSEASPVVRTWDTAGVYWCSLEIVDDDGQTATTWRPVFIFERTGENAPHDWSGISAIHGDWRMGGWSVELGTFAEAEASDVPEGTLLVLFAEEWFGETEQSIGGYPYRENIKFVGRIGREDTQWGFAPDDEQKVRFRAATLQEQMKGTENRPQYLTDAAAGAVWPEVTDLTAKKAAYIILKWYSTIFEIADVWLPDVERALRTQEFPKVSNWEQVDGYLSSALFAHACFDKQGALWLKQDPQCLPTASRTGLTEVLDVTDRLRERLEVPHPHQVPVNYVKLSGEYYNGSVANTLLAQAPGASPKARGNSKAYDNLILGNQAAANAQAGAVLGALNNLWTGIPFKLDGNHSYMDVAPPSYFLHTLEAAETVRGVAWDAARFVPQTVDLRYDAEAGTLDVDVVADRESVPQGGATLEYPVGPPEEPVEPPEPPPPEWPPVVPPPEEISKWAAVGKPVTGPGLTSQMNETPTDWENRVTGLTDTATLFVHQLRGWQVLQGTSDPESAIFLCGGVGFLAVTRDGMKTWTDRTPSSLNITWAGDDPGITGDITLRDADSPNDASETFVVIGDAESATEGVQVVVVLTTDDLGLTYRGEYVVKTGLVAADFTAWAGTQDHGLYVSQDFTFGAGTPTWTNVGTGPTGVTLWGFGGSGALPCCVTNTGNVWVYGESGLSLLKTYAQIQAIVGNACSLPSGIFTDGTSVYVTVRGAFGDGRTYIVNCTAGSKYRVDDNFQNYGVGRIKDCRTNPYAVYAMGSEGKMLGTGGGPMAAWTERATVCSYLLAMPVYVDPMTSSTVFSSLTTGLARSTNSAVSFATIATGSNAMQSMWIPKSDTTKLMWGSVAFGGGYSTDNGSTWNNFPTYLGSGWSIAPACWGDDNTPGAVARGGAKNANNHVIDSTPDYGANFYDKAGAMPGTSPYTNSIPKDRIITEQGLYIEPNYDPVDAQALGIAIDLEDGTRIYVTYKGNDDAVAFACYDDELALVRSYDLTTYEDAGDMYPRCVWQPTVEDFGDLVYLFGQDTTPNALLLESADAGATWTDRTGAMATETKIAALAAKGDGSGQLAYFYAMTSDLHVWGEEGTWDWTQVGDIPFEPPPRGLSIGYDANLTALMMNAAAGAQQAMIAPFYYTSWEDRTGDLPTDEGCVYGEWVTP